MKLKFVVRGLVALAIGIVLSFGFMFYSVSRMRNGHFSKSMNNHMQEALRSGDEERQLRTLVFMKDWSPSVQLRPDIESMIESDSSEVRSVALELVGWFGDQKALDMLVLHSDDADPDVAEEIQSHISEVRNWMNIQQDDSGLSEEDK